MTNFTRPGSAGLINSLRGAFIRRKMVSASASNFVSLNLTAVRFSCREVIKLSLDASSHASLNSFFAYRIAEVSHFADKRVSIFHLIHQLRRAQYARHLLDCRWFGVDFPAALALRASASPFLAAVTLFARTNRSFHSPNNEFVRSPRHRTI